MRFIFILCLIVREINTVVLSNEVYEHECYDQTISTQEIRNIINNLSRLLVRDCDKWPSSSHFLNQDQQNFELYVNYDKYMVAHWNDLFSNISKLTEIDFYVQNGDHLQDISNLRQLESLKITIVDKPKKESLCKF